MMLSRENKVFLRLPVESDFAGYCEIRRDSRVQSQLMSTFLNMDDNAVQEWIDRKSSDRNMVFLSVADELSDEYLGYVQILLGVVNLWFVGFGLYFWAMGFGVMHIVYGIYMWQKYERK